jgi:hypothetical protein
MAATFFKFIFILIFFNVKESVQFNFTKSVPIDSQFNVAEIMAQIPQKSLTKNKEKSLLMVTILHSYLLAKRFFGN